MLECHDKTYYIGYTNDLNSRIETHNKGKGAKYTKGRLPVKLIYSEVFSTKGEALKREYALKKLTRKAKEELLNSQG